MHDVRVATAADAGAIGRLLHDFNTEYDDVTQGPAAMSPAGAEEAGLPA
jgi:hypothetical protein